MSLENHPALHYALVMVFYNIGLLINVLAAAHLSTHSSLTGTSSILDYCKLRWVPLTARWFICLCMFLIVWGNPSVLNLERFMPNFGAHLGVAGGLGWLSDSVWDKVLAIVFPGIQKELPAVPDASDTGKSA